MASRKAPRLASSCASPTPSHRVFVYGSLLRGLHNHHLLRSARRVQAPACTAASAFVLVDSGAGYPYAVAHERAREGDTRSRLVGEVYEVSDAVLERLDALECHPDWYRRSRQPIEDDEQPAWIYLMEDEQQLAAIHSDPASFPVATAGDWRAHLRETLWGTTRLTSASSGPHAVFCYGSNGVAQLRERVRNPRLASVAATLPEAERVFGGWSNRWGGAVASIVPSFSGRAVRGSVVMLTESELEMLDGFEGVDPEDVYGRGGVYRRQDVEVRIEGERTRSAVAYVKNCLDWRGPPSEAYLAACRTHLLDVWDAEDAAVEVRDGTGELRE